MSKATFAAILVAGLIAAPLPTVTPSASAQATQSAASPTTDVNTNKPKKAPSTSVVAMRERQKKCGAEWKAAKAAGTIEKGQTWPKYWSTCNKRLKAAN